jgi:hypothetical protein
LKGGEEGEGGRTRRCLFLSMVVWQPFEGCWRLIIARVSEMHVAYHRNVLLMGSLFIGTNKQRRKQKHADPLLYILPASLWWAVRSREMRVLDSSAFVLCLQPLEYLFVVYCSSVWSFGSHLTLAGVKSLRVSPKCTTHIITAY